VRKILMCLCFDISIGTRIGHRLNGEHHMFQWRFAVDLSHKKEKIILSLSAGYDNIDLFTSS
jgi:hypothetical protein